MLINRVGHTSTDFFFLILNTYVLLMFDAKFQPYLSRGSGEVDFVIFAIFSNCRLLGYLT